MKLTKLTLAILSVGVLVTSGANAATVYSKDNTEMDIYGRVQSVLYTGSADATPASRAYGDHSLSTSGRLGFNLRTDIGYGMTGIANMEWDVADSSVNNNFNARYIWVGVDMGQYGIVKVGRMEDAIKPVLAATDIFDDWGCVGQAGNDDKRDAVIYYSWADFGFDVNASMQLAANGQHVDGLLYNTPSAEAETADIDQAYALSAGYTLSDVLGQPLVFKAGYSAAIFQYEENQKAFEARGYQQYAGSVSWGNLKDGLYLGALIQHRDFKAVKSLHNPDYDVDGYELVVGYALPNGVSIHTGYNYISYESDDGDETKASTVPLYVNYQINPQFNVWGEARFNINTDEHSSNSFYAVTGQHYNTTVASVGLRYTF